MPSKIDLIKLEGTPGTEFTRVDSLDNVEEDFDESSGVISGIVHGPPHARSPDRERITRFSYLFPTSFNGIPRYSVKAKAMYNGNIHLFARYKNVRAKDRSSSEGVRFSISHGSVNIKVFNTVDSLTTLESERGRDVPARLITIKWNFDEDRTPRMVDVPSGLKAGYIRNGTLNKNWVRLNGLKFKEKSLKYIGPESQWQNGEWDYMHVALHRTYYPLNVGETPPPDEDSSGDPVSAAKHWEQPYITANDEPGFRDIIPASNWR